MTTNKYFVFAPTQSFKEENENNKVIITELETKRRELVKQAQKLGGL